MSFTNAVTKTPIIVWNHFQGVLSNHFAYGKKLREVQKFEKAIVGFDQVAKTNLHGRVSAFKAGVHNRIKPALPHPEFIDRVGKTHNVAMSVMAPLSVYHFAGEAGKSFASAYSTSSDLLRFTYHITRAMGSLAIASISVSAAMPGTVLLLELSRASEQLLQVCDIVGKCTFRIFFVLGLTFPITYALEAYQSHNVTDLTKLDPVIIKDAFGLKPNELAEHVIDTGKKALLNKQLAFYKRTRMFQTANSIVELICSTALSASPVTLPFALMALAVSLVAKLGAEYWLKHKVTLLRVDLKIPPKKGDPIISTASRIVSAVATPFLSVAKSAPIAAGVIAVSVVVDIAANLNQA